ncbi:phosphopantetheine-binding protein [Kitasatospora sp. NPDC088346]|uniref:phosphopantetheine-binding protein n=1 Tax=Kitasatospora sp. NPDC088346 TaxID=3364073 RepID=UPI0037F595CA
MTDTSSSNFEILVELIKDVKPGLGDRVVEPADSVVEELGLDSLDLLQLSRKITRRLGADFDLDAWNEGAEKHNRSVESILAVIGADASV